MKNILKLFCCIYLNWPLAHHHKTKHNCVLFLIYRHTHAITLTTHQLPFAANKTSRTPSFFLHCNDLELSKPTRNTKIHQNTKMQSLNKIHINGSTKISLSDRFSILQSTAPPPFKATPAKINGRRNSRSRSRSRSIHPSATVQSAPNRAVNPKASIRNRNLLAQLDQKQKMRAALKIKRVRSWKTSQPPSSHILDTYDETYGA